MKIAVIGAGWLGVPLCERLQSAGHDVVATKRDQTGCDEVANQGITAFPFTLHDESIPEGVWDADIFIVNIPPGRQEFEQESFQANMLRLLRQCLASKEKRLLFVSTTAVYGESYRIITENSELDPITDSAKAHCYIESHLRDNYFGQFCVLRLAGLVGGDRHPVYHLAGKQGLWASHKMVNLVHLEDVINAILKIIEKKLWGNTFHLCAQEHPSRMEYYCWAATELELEPPTFFDDSEAPKTGKQVDPSATLDKLGLALLYPSPFDMLK